MKSSIRFGSALVMGIALLMAVSGVAGAKSGGGGNGGGGGGGSTTPTGTPLTFTNFSAVNGTTPSCSGDYSITNPIPGYYQWTTFKVSVKAKPLDVPDNTNFGVILYTKDAVTGAALPPVPLANMVVLKSVGLSKSDYVFVDTGILFGGITTLRLLDKVVIVAPDGTTVAVGR